MSMLREATTCERCARAREPRLTGLTNHASNGRGEAGSEGGAFRFEQVNPRANVRLHGRRPCAWHGLQDGLYCGSAVGGDDPPRVLWRSWRGGLRADGRVLGPPPSIASACSATARRSHHGETAAVLDDMALMPRLAKDGERVRVSPTSFVAADGVFVISALPPALHSPLACALRLIEEVQFPSEAALAARCSSIMSPARSTPLLRASNGDPRRAVHGCHLERNARQSGDAQRLAHARRRALRVLWAPAERDSRADSLHYIARHRPCSGRAAIQK